jgi:putative peptide zinc metalloprotease protein
MRNPIRVILATAATVAATALAPALASASDNVAVVTGKKDGKTVYKLKFNISRDNDGVVDDGNAAVAIASCDGCETVAAAIQGVLVFTEPDTFTPTNLAIAENIDCDGCQTLASAYQVFVQTDGPAHFTPEGNREIADIRQDFHALRHWHTSIDYIQQRIDELASELAQVMETEVVPAGPPA